MYKMTGNLTGMGNDYLWIHGVASERWDIDFPQTCLGPDVEAPPKIKKREVCPTPGEMWWDTLASGGESGPDYVINRFGCDKFRPVGSNTAVSCFPEIDKLALPAQQELDRTKSDAVMKTVQEMLSQQAPAVWLFSITQLTGTSAKLHDPAIVNELLYVDGKTWLEE